MRNLWIFLRKYNAFFYFVFFLGIALSLVVRRNSYQHASFINSSAAITGEAYNRINSLKEYLDLKPANDRLVAENAALRKQLESSYYYDTVQRGKVNDSTRHQQYTFIAARVINNSVNQKDNFITIDRGANHGIRKGMGVITANGVIGIVKNVNANYSSITSLLNSDTHISATIEGSNAFGSLIWGNASYNPRIALLQDIQNHIDIRPGQKVVTTQASTLFPGGHPIGKVLRVNKNSGNSSWDIQVQLYTDFATLHYVYIVDNLMGQAQQQVETGSTSK
jgi:rod shape-determining protein MreC